MLLLDQYPYLDLHETDGLFISTFFERKDSQKRKVAEMAEETLKYRVVDYSKDQTAENEKSIDEYLEAKKQQKLRETVYFLE